MIFRIAWRNIWRNKLRSLVVMTAVTLGLWAGVFILAFSWGIYETRIHDAITREISHIQIHHPQYKADKDINYFIPHDQKVTDQINAHDEVEAVTSRILVNSMIASPAQASGVNVNGIELHNEDTVTQLISKIIEGDYFESIKRNPVLISQRLAENLKVKLRSKVVLTFQDKDGEMASAAFRITGLFKSNNSKYDLGNVFVKKEDLAPHLKIESGVHEIAILLKSHDQTDPMRSRFLQQLPDLKVESWGEVMPEMQFAIDSFDASTNIIISIIMLALAFGIINTMLMAVLERVREIGMLMAIGMTKPKIFSMIMIETIVLSLIGGAFGMLLGHITVLYFGRAGIDLSVYSTAMEEFGLSSIVYLSLDDKYYLHITIQVIVITILASIYPAWKALRLKPVKAIRKI